MFFRRSSNRPSSNRGRSSHVSRKARGLGKESSGAHAYRHMNSIEQLEQRQLLTTLTGGGANSTATYEFLDGDQNTIRIALRGNITVELIGVWPRATDNKAPLSPVRDVITDMIRPKQPNPLNPDEDLPGAYLYSIYIAQADMDSSIAIAQVPPQSQGADQGRPMQPFGGGSQNFNIVNSRTGDQDKVSPAGSSGAVLFGAITGDFIEGTTDEEDIAILSEPLKRDFGVRPRTPKGKVDAGLNTAPGVNIGQILLGGTIIGRVNIGGSVGLFYAGQIWTGDARGIPDFSAPNFPRNFEVGGDLRQLVSIGSLGTDAIDDPNIEEVDFKTGFDLRVHGRLGQILTKDSFLGSVSVQNDSTFIGPGTPIQEIEVRGVPKRFSESFFEGNDFLADPRLAGGSLGDNPIFNNDTPETAELVGTIRSATFGGRVLAEIDGELNGDARVNDHRDYYGMALLAGQTVEVQLQSRVAGPFVGASQDVAVIDPDGRMIASDYTNNVDDIAVTQYQPFRFTADRPGVYKFVVGDQGDINFNGVIDANPGEGVAVVASSNPYKLTIDRVADVALGGIVASGSIGNTDFFDPENFFPGTFPSIQVDNGDLGALLTTGGGTNGGGGTGAVFAAAAPFTVSRGNLRAIDSDSIGVLRNNEPVVAPDLHVPRGTVGLLRGRGTDLTSQCVAVNLTFVPSGAAGTFNTADAIGFDYQLVDARSIMAGNLMADRGIGIVRAAQFSTGFVAPRFAANADNIGNDGFIDLLDSSGDFGTLTAGGPQLSTGTAGNVRYVHSGGAYFRDRFFGGGSLDFTRLNPGVPFRYTDDSGTSIKITPLPIVPLGGDTFLQNGLTVITYGVRDKGGSALAFLGLNSPRVINDVEQATGILIDSGNGTSGGGAEIGDILLNGTGAPITFVTQDTDATGNTISVRRFDTNRSNSLDMTLSVKGRRPVSVFTVRGTNINSLDNRTSGEIVNLTANSVGLLQANNIGIAASHTKTTLGGATVIRDVFPFNEQRTLINVTGPIQTINARGAVGNVFSGSTIGDITANSDGVDDKSLIEGIDAPIVTTGSILSVNIGEMVTPSGAGDTELSGIFAGGVIGAIRNQGQNSDIRGDIVAEQNSILPATATLPGVAGIGSITMINGAIIDADIMVARFIDVQDLPHALVLAGSTDFFFPAVIPNMGNIKLEGNGGIIGGTIGANSLGALTIKNGFGLIDSTIIQSAGGDFDGVDTDGYGIRYSRMDGGSTIGHVIARGAGKIIDTRSYTGTVRQSESLSFDQSSGRLLTRVNDLHKFLGTTRKKPKNSNTSVAGTIEDTTITGARDLNLLSAFRITGRPEVLDVITQRQHMRISFAENIGKFTIAENINGLDLTAGAISLLQSGKDMLNNTMNVSGLLKQLSANNIKASNTIEVQGDQGRIGTITTKRALFGRISAATRIDTINIGTDLGSRSLSSSNDIGIVTINGNILSGALLRAADQIEQLIVHGNIDEGGTVRAKRIGSQTIDGSVSGDIVIG